MRRGNSEASRVRLRSIVVLHAVWLCAISLASRESLASEGRIEINQARALAGGTTASDSPGFPVTLDTPGSYVLTGALEVAGSSSAILITASDVTLDLAGFRIQGPCTTGPGCTASSGSGVGVQSTALSGVFVRNGDVRGFAIGLFLGVRARVRDLHVEANANEGIRTDAQSDVVDSRSLSNGRAGIVVGDGSKVLRCVADLNGRNGIEARSRSIVSGNLSRNNVDLANGLSDGNGIYTNSAVLVRSNGTSANGRSGIRVEGSANLLIDNVVSENGSVGIYVLSSGSVQRNVVTHNSGSGILSFGTSANRTSFRENVVDANVGGTLSGGVSFGTNACNGATGC